MAEKTKSNIQDKLKSYMLSDDFQKLSPRTQERLSNYYESTTNIKVDTVVQQRRRGQKNLKTGNKSLYELTGQDFAKIGKFAGIFTGDLAAFSDWADITKPPGYYESEGRLGVSAANAAAFGAPERLARASGIEIRPEGGGGPAGVGTAIGMITGGPTRLASAVGERFFPLAFRFPKLASFAQKLRLAALEGAVFGATDITGKESITPIERSAKIGTYAAGGLVAGAGSSIASASSKIIGSTFRAAGGISKHTVDIIRKYGDKVWNPIKGDAEYIGKNLVPRIKDAISTTLEKGKNALPFLKELGLDNNTAARISQRGFERVKQNGTNKAYETLIQDIDDGLLTLKKEADSKFYNMIKNHPNIEFNPTRWYYGLRKILQGYRLVDLKGNITQDAYKTGVSTIDKLVRLYEDYTSKTKVGNVLRTKINPKQFDLLKIQLENAIGKTPQVNRHIYQLNDNLTKDAIQALPERKEASRLFSKFKPFYDRYFQKKAIEINKLHHITTLGSREKQSLEQLNKVLPEKYRFIETAKDIHNYEDIIKIITPWLDDKTLQTRMFETRIPENYVQRQRFSSIMKSLGRNDIIDDLSMHLAHMDFLNEVASPIMGAGSITSLRRGFTGIIAQKALKGYYKWGYPKVTAMAAILKNTSIKPGIASSLILRPVIGEISDSNTEANAEEIHSGKASFYGNGEKLNKFTASGEKFNPNNNTAAMYDIPFGSKVRVTNKDNNKSTIVKINDRGPNKRLNRAIDLSRGAFEKIADKKKGLIDVDIEVLSTPLKKGKMKGGK